MKFFLISLIFILTKCYSHELNENRANITIRENRTITVNLYLNAANFLQKGDGVNVTPLDVIAKMSSIGEPEFALVTSKLFENIEKHTQLLVNKKNKQVLTWKWPEPEAIRRHFKHMLMDLAVQNSVGESAHFHEVPLQLVSISISPEPINSLEFQASSDFFPLTVVVSRISQKSALSNAQKLNFDFNPIP